MTDQELKIKVAELSKWESTFTGEYEPNEGGRSMHAVWTEMPDYPYDLNAMNGAETIFIGNQALQVKFLENLDDILQSEIVGAGKENLNFAEVHATARQRAEAFVKTMSKAT